MADPERLLASSGAEHCLERELLESVRALVVPAHAKRVVWSNLAVYALPTALGAGAGSSLPALRAALKLAASSKAALTVPVLLVALGAGWLEQRRVAAPPERTAEHAQPLETVRAKASLDAPSLIEPSAPLPSAPTAALPRADRLAQESAQLTRARAELRAGRPRAAQALLARMQRSFGSGVLRQEREVLAIEALAALGETTAAAGLARAFVAEHPESPHAPGLLRFDASH